MRTWNEDPLAARPRGRTGRIATVAAGVVVAVAGCASVRGQRASEGAADASRARGIVPPTTRAKVAEENSFNSPQLGFAIDKPAGDEWAMATDVTSPEGRPIPVVVAHPGSGTQIVVQVSRPLGPPHDLADMLRGKLEGERELRIGDTKRLQNKSGLEAWGFTFAVKGEASGRVAIVQVGEHVVLVVASWPEAADKKLVQAVDDVVASVRMASEAEPTLSRPDKA